MMTEARLSSACSAGCAEAVRWAPSGLWAKAGAVASATSTAVTLRTTARPANE